MTIYRPPRVSKKTIMSYNTIGRIKVINDTQTFPSGFQKREFVVTVPNGEWPQDLKFELTKDNVVKLDQLAIGDEIEVEFDIRGNEYNDKYYVNLSAWRIKATQEGQQQQPAQQPAPQQQPTPHPAPQQQEMPAGDEIPF
tara:strand:- start:727 stop:1146 length:420 start_codon:yes stop_codon:yes gene_type:complete